MSKLTKQGLSGSLLEAMEFGFKAQEHGYSLDQAREEILPKIKTLVEACDNLPREVLRIDWGVKSPSV